ncbi:MAG: transglutaminase-like domain-containing protein [Candidatus Binatia bacterium]
MKRRIRPIAIVILALIMTVGAAWFVLTRPVTIRRGVDYRITEIQMPLYLKLLAYVHRHFEYRQLARRLVDGMSDREEKILTLFEWTRKNVRPIPKGYPIVDDHVWDIIVRGYGSQDQAADVFATLCAYAGIPAHFGFACTPKKNSCVGVAFVQLPNGSFGLFDPHYGVAVRHPDGRLASIEEIRTDQSLLERTDPALAGYAKYFEKLPKVSVDTASRTSCNMPLRRLFIVMTGGQCGRRNLNRILEVFKDAKPTR